MGSQTNKSLSYIRYILANSCMPTLLMKKPASMVSVRRRNVERDSRFIDLLIRELSSFGAEYEVLFEDEKFIHLFIYQPKLMRAFFNGHRNHYLMNEYCCCSQEATVDKCLQCLKEKFRAYKLGREEFPHEMGIFFGYPIKDIEKYIAQSGKNFLFCGYWKVYDNPEQAMRRFRMYDEFKEKALHLISSGKELTEMSSYI